MTMIRRVTIVNSVDRYIGWYALTRSGEDWKPLSMGENRHSIALSDALDVDATHVGYWNGTEWEDVKPSAPEFG